MSVHILFFSHSSFLLFFSHYSFFTLFFFHIIHIIQNSHYSVARNSYQNIGLKIVGFRTVYTEPVPSPRGGFGGLSPVMKFVRFNGFLHPRWLADYLTFRGGRLPASPWYCIYSGTRAGVLTLFHSVYSNSSLIKPRSGCCRLRSVQLHHSK